MNAMATRSAMHRAWHTHIIIIHTMSQGMNTSICIINNNLIIYTMIRISRWSWTVGWSVEKARAKNSVGIVMCINYSNTISHIRGQYAINAKIYQQQNILRSRKALVINRNEMRKNERHGDQECNAPCMTYTYHHNPWAMSNDENEFEGGRKGFVQERHGDRHT